MASVRKLAILAGVFFLVTHVTSVAALILYGPILNDVNFIVSTGSAAEYSVLIGAFLEVILAFAIIGTAVTLFPVVKKQNEAVGLGYVGLRTLEAGIITLGIISLLAALTLRQNPGSDPDSTMALGGALVAIHNWTFLLGPGFTSGTDTVLLAYLMYRSRLVPRLIPILGLIGGPLVFASATAVLFGLYGQYSTTPAVLALPEFAWELSLAIYLIAKGFRTTARLLQ